MPNTKKYSLGAGHLGNGLTVWNRLEDAHGDYKTVAHIAPDRTIKYYEELPEEQRIQVEAWASGNPTISATQDQPVFYEA